jgi:hypothetical protein
MTSAAKMCSDEADLPSGSEVADFVEKRKERNEVRSLVKLPA